MPLVFEIRQIFLMLCFLLLSERTISVFENICMNHEQGGKRKINHLDHELPISGSGATIAYLIEGKFP